MLLTDQYQLLIISATCLTVLSTFFSVFLYAINDVRSRLFIVCLIACLALICIAMTRLAARIEPVVSLYREGSDQNFLISLFEKVGLKESEEITDLPTTTLYDIPLQHFQFLDLASLAYFKQEITAKYAGSKFVDLSDKKQKLILHSELQSRQTSPKSKDEPLFIITNDPKWLKQDLLTIGCYTLLHSSDSGLPVSTKFLTGATLKTVMPELEDFTGCFVESKGTIKRLPPIHF